MGRMTIGQCMDFAFQLLNQYSIAGNLVPLSYNDQADDQNRMLNLINDAQMELATTVRPIYSSVTITVPPIDPRVPTTDIATKMPYDFYMPETVRFTPLHGHDQTMREAPRYKWQNNDELLVPSRPAGSYLIDYKRYPKRYEPGTSKSIELDGTPDTHEAIPYYVAAMIALDQNPKAYSALYNVWETRLARMGMKTPYTSVTTVEDDYGFDRFVGLREGVIW